MNRSVDKFTSMKCQLSKFTELRVQSFFSLIDQKHRSPQSRKTMYRGLTPAQYLKVKEVGDLMMGELVIKALMNGNRNYNGPRLTTKAIIIFGDVLLYFILEEIPVEKRTKKDDTVKILI